MTRITELILAVNTALYLIYYILGALVLKYSKTTDSWTACETNVYVGEVLKMDVEGRQRQAFRVQYLHQELLLGRSGP